MKQYTFSELKAVIEAFIEYQLEHAFNKGEAVINQLCTIHELTAEMSHCLGVPHFEKYTFSLSFAVDVCRVGEPPFDEYKYTYRYCKIDFVLNEPINILEVLNKVDTMLEQATKPYFN